MSWQNQAKQSTNNIEQEALAYLENLPVLLGTGPSVRLLLELKTSKLIGMQGDLKSVLGIPYEYGISLDSFIPFVLLEHNKFIAKHFPVYLEYTLSSKPDDRNMIDYSIDYLYLKNNKYNWMSQRVFRSFSDNMGVLTHILMEYTDISAVKRNNLVRFIAYDRKNDHYIVNASEESKQVKESNLTSTETQITCMISEGLSDYEIAAVRTISSETVKQHRKNIYKKLKINKSTQLVKWAYENNVV